MHEVQLKTDTELPDMAQREHGFCSEKPESSSGDGLESQIFREKHTDMSDTRSEPNTCIESLIQPDLKSTQPSEQLLRWLHRRKLARPVPHAKILVPLYIYPIDEHSWQPLYQAISNNPDCEFVIIVNPNSGPGNNSLPSGDYLREIPKLNNYRNVQVIGYLKIDYCHRPLSETFFDIETYAGWSAAERPGLFVEGIYIDETPNHFTEERAQYLHALRKYIGALPGFSERRLIFENPGTPPDKELAWYAGCGPDVIVTSEEPYDRFIGDEVQQRLNEFHYDQLQSAYLISGVPRELIGAFVRGLHHWGAYLFVTDLVDDFYESFGEGWSDFIRGF